MSCLSQALVKVSLNGVSSPKGTLQPFAYVSASHRPSPCNITLLLDSRRNHPNIVDIINELCSP